VLLALGGLFKRIFVFCNKKLFTGEQVNLEKGRLRAIKYEMLLCSCIIGSYNER